MPEQIAMSVALQARDMATAAQNTISTHEAVCAERWQHVSDQIGSLRTDLQGVKGTISKQSWGVVMVLVTLLGWGGAQLYANLTTHSQAPQAVISQAK